MLDYQKFLDDHPAAPRREMLEIPLRKTRDRVAERAEQQLETAIELLSLEQSRGDLAASDWGMVEAVAPPAANESIELSIVITCLNHANTVGRCVLKANYALEELGIHGEVIVADSGSRDDSVEIAESLGAKVVHVLDPGYGAAVMGGTEAAKGTYVLVGDADDECDFSEATVFYSHLREGAEFVQGCRLPSSGNRSWSSRLSTWFARRMCQTEVRDVTCGMRAFSKQLYERLGTLCTGTEFTTEMIVKAARLGVQIREVPLIYEAAQDDHEQLGMWREAWNAIRLLGVVTPHWPLWLLAGVSTTLGSLGCFVVILRLGLNGRLFGTNTLLLSVLCLCLAAQLGSFSMLKRSVKSLYAR
jgi:glycosyltransferase involved in cell wall biosynthesis